MMHEKEEEEEEGDMRVCVLGVIAFSILVLERAVRACVWMERVSVGRVGRSPHWRGGSV